MLIRLKLFIRRVCPSIQNGPEPKLTNCFWIVYSSEVSIPLFPTIDTAGIVLTVTENVTGRTVTGRTFWTIGHFYIDILHFIDKTEDRTKSTYKLHQFVIASKSEHGWMSKKMHDNKDSKINVPNVAIRSPYNFAPIFKIKVNTCPSNYREQEKRLTWLFLKTRCSNMVIILVFLTVTGRTMFLAVTEMWQEGLWQEGIIWCFRLLLHWSSLFK